MTTDAAAFACSTPLDLVELTVERAQAALASGAITCEALTQGFLDRIALFNLQYNALLFVNPNALADARAIDRRRAAGETLPALAGIPVVIKDTMDMAGFPTTGGWSLLCAGAGGVDLIPDSDAPVVARLRMAGAIILGKTNVPVLSATGSHANDSWAGPTYNAAGRAFLPGGSSAGTATAVAASLAILGLGEETGGSIQNPASAQALVGIKPSFALVPNTGVMPLAASTRDVVGPIARCVRDAALVLDVLAGFTTQDPKTVASIGQQPPQGYAAALDPHALRGKRLGLFGPGWRDQPLAPEVARLYRRAMDELQVRGAVLVADPFLESGFAAISKPVAGSFHYDARGMECMPHDMQAYLERLGPNAAIRSFAAFAAATVKQDAFAASGVLHILHQLPQFADCLADPMLLPNLSDFVDARQAYLRIFNDVMHRQRLDALVFPQMLDVLPPLHGADTIHETTVSEINIAGLPGVTVPAGYHESGAPFGLIFVGRLWSEALLLSLAYDYECATRHRQAPVLASA